MWELVAQRCQVTQAGTFRPTPIVLEKEIVWLYLILFNILLMIPAYLHTLYLVTAPWHERGFSVPT